MKEIKKTIFKDLTEMQNTISILSTVKSDPVKYSIILHLSHFISTLLPLITTTLTDAYKSMLRDMRAQQIAEAEKKKRSIETSTSSIAGALSNEESMPSNYMDNILEKKVDKNLKKSLAKNLKACKQVTLFAKGLNQSNHQTTSQESIRKKKGSPSIQKSQRKNVNHSTSPSNHNPQKTQNLHSPKNTPVKGKKRKWKNKWNRSSDAKGKRNESLEE